MDKHKREPIEAIPAKITLIYTIAGAAWVLVAGRLASTTSESTALLDPDVLEGLLFVVVSAVLLNRLLSHYISAIGRSEQARVEAVRTIEHITNYDQLTDMPNRNLLRELLRAELAKAKNDGRLVAILSVNLDRFNNVNDFLGTNVGNLLLKRVAERLTGSLRKPDFAARVGDQEFNVIFANVKQEEVAAAAGRLLAKLTGAYLLENEEVFLTASIGIALWPQDGQDAEALLGNAGAAMRRAKEAGGDKYWFYAEQMHAEALTKLALDNNLRRALDRQELISHYQPCVDLASGKIVSAEALARWIHPQKGLIFPDEFIPLAEKDGCIVDIGELMLRTACAQNKAWQRAGRQPLSLSVNLSAKDFENRDLPLKVAAILEQTGLESSYLELEITEGVIMNDLRAAAATLTDLKDMGIRILMDDFGTGYSSLGALTEFPIDAIKLDRSFIKNLTTDPHNAVIIKAIISMAHILEMKVIAEGVETAEQLDFLRALNCDAIQGFYYSRPLSARNFDKLLIGWREAA